MKTKLNLMMILIVLLSGILLSSPVYAGGWDADKGLDKITLQGELVCLGCSLKKLDGANAQCNLFAHHAIGFKTLDGTLWSIVDNEKGHDIIRAHALLEHKNATIKGWIFPIANQIEIHKIKVDGVSAKEIAQAGWEEDQLLAKRLASRAVGQAPQTAHSH